MLIRQLKPIKGSPMIKVKCKPTFENNSILPFTTRHSTHLRFHGTKFKMRLVSDIPILFIAESTPFILRGKKYLVLMQEENIGRPIQELCKQYLLNTREYWSEWCKYISLPPDYQIQVQRAIITLKLLHFEETGAFLSSLTTSIPSYVSIPRFNEHQNEDLRYCWIMDSFWVIRLLSKLALTRSAEEYLGYLFNLASYVMRTGAPLQTSYRAVYSEPRTTERESNWLAGYKGFGPVMIGQPFYSENKDSTYPIGSLVLSLIYLFYDTRFTQMQKLVSFDYYDLIRQLAERGYSNYKKPMKHHLQYLSVKFLEESKLEAMSKLSLKGMSASDAKSDSSKIIADIEGKFEAIPRSKDQETASLLSGHDQSPDKILSSAKSICPQEMPETSLKDLDQKKLNDKIERFERLGINTYTIVLIWASCKALARLAKNLEEGKLPLKYLDQFQTSKTQIEQEIKQTMSEFSSLEKPQGYEAQIMFARDFEKWEARAQQLRRFIDKYAWCPKHKCYTAYIRVREVNQKGEEIKEDSERFKHFNCDAIDSSPYEEFFHNPDKWVLLYPELGFVNHFDQKFRSSIQRVEETKVINAGTTQIFQYILALDGMDNDRKKKARKMFKKCQEFKNKAGMMSGTVTNTNPEGSYELWGNIPDLLSLTFFCQASIATSNELRIIT